MSIRERGLGTGALVAIIVGVVVAIVVPVTIAAVLLMGGGADSGGGVGPSGLPVYSGAQEFTQMSLEDAMAASGQQLPTGWSGKIYTTSDNANNVTVWYKANMPGWTKVMDNTMDLSQFGAEGTVIILGFTKGNDGAMITLYEVTGSGVTVIVLLSGPASDLET